MPPIVSSTFLRATASTNAAFFDDRSPAWFVAAAGAHRYAFQRFALAEGPAFTGTPGRDAVMEVLAERAIASGCLIGTYERDTTVKTGGATAIA